MKKIFAIIPMVFLGSVVYADKPKEAPPEVIDVTHCHRHAKALDGTVGAVDTIENRLMVKDGHGTTTYLEIPAGASVVIGSKMGALSDLSNGDNVTVTFAKNGTVKGIVKKSPASL